MKSVRRQWRRRAFLSAGVFLVLLFLWGMEGAMAELPLRFYKPRYRQGPPPIVLVAFGTSTAARATYREIEKAVREAFPGHELRLALSSRIVRRVLQKGGEGVESLPQVLADLEARGWRKAVVQSLHVFPGEEYRAMVEESRIPGIRVSVGEPLFSKWEDVRRVLEAMRPEVPSPSEGCALFVAHGSPNTYSSPSTAIYLALDRLIRTLYPGAALGTIEGVPDEAEALSRARACKGRKIRIIPLMMVAGDHVMNDLMGEEAGPEGPSWAARLESSGKLVDAPRLEGPKWTGFKGLGYYTEVRKIIVEHIKEALSEL